MEDANQAEACGGSMEPLEEYHSPFDFEQGVNASYLYLSCAHGDTPPDSPAGCSRGNRKLSANSLPEVGEDAASSVGGAAAFPVAFVPSLTPEEQEELQGELAKVEDEIQTLSHVLAAKETELAEIKRKLGITPLNELKQNFTRSWQEVTTSSAYKKTSESFTLAGQKASAAFTTMGTAITRKFEDVKNKPSFKTFEERVGTLKTKMSATGTLGSSGGSQDDVTGPNPEPLYSQVNEMPNQEPPTH